MGYRKTVRRIEISLKGHKVYGQDDEFPVAYARGKTLDEYLLLVGMREPAEGDDRNLTIRQLEEFAASLISWNLEREDGTAIPCTTESFFREVDNDLALAMATEWVEILGGKVADDPLAGSSPSGEASPVASIPTEALSAPQSPTSVPA